LDQRSGLVPGDFLQKSCFFKDHIE